MLKVTTVSLLLVALVTGGPVQAAGKHSLLKQRWTLYESDHFSFMTNLKEEPATVMLRDLEQFRQVVLAITSLGEVEEPIGTRAIVFAKASQFNKIAFKKNIGGYMRSSFRGNRMVTSGDTLGMDQRLVMFHEYIHHLVRIASDRNYPTWYDEGLADTLATIYVEHGNVIVGATSEARISGLQSNLTRVPLARIVNEDSLNRLHPRVVSYFYAMSWALVNFLQTSHLAGLPNRHEQLQTYLNLLTEQGDREAAFEQAFGMSPLAMEKLVFKFLERKRRPILSLPAEKFSYAGKISKRAMPAAEVALELVFETMSAKPREAHKIIDSVLADQPKDPRLLGAKGVIHQIEGQFVAGEALLRRAQAMRPDDVVLAIDHAKLLISWNFKECQQFQTPSCKQRLQTARQIYTTRLGIGTE